ncbi:MAG TPA: hypothetical protein V6C78_12720 [Crinalium sp.]
MSEKLLTGISLNLHVKPLQNFITDMASQYYVSKVTRQEYGSLPSKLGSVSLRPG